MLELCKTPSEIAVAIDFTAQITNYTLLMLSRVTYALLGSRPSAEAILFVNFKPYKPQARAGSRRLPVASSRLVYAYNRMLVLTVRSKGVVDPVISSNRAPSARSTTFWSLIAICSRIPRRKIVDTLVRRFFRSSKGIQLLFTNDDGTLINQKLYQSRSLRLWTVAIRVCTVAIRGFDTLQVYIVFDSNPFPAQWFVT